MTLLDVNLLEVILLDVTTGCDPIKHGLHCCGLAEAVESVRRLLSMHFNCTSFQCLPICLMADLQVQANAARGAVWGGWVMDLEVKSLDFFLNLVAVLLWV